MVAADKIAVVLPSEIHVYKKIDGKSPFDKWLKKHSKSNIGASVDQALERVRCGKAVKVKSYEGKIGAIVLSWPKKIRIYYGVDSDNTIILLGGGESGQTTDIKNALGYWRDYCEREGE